MKTKPKKNETDFEKLKRQQKKRINTVRTNREINRMLVDDLISLKHCPLLTNDFDCGKRDGYNLKKGKEPQCHRPDCVNCPGFNQYITHEFRANRRKVGDEK